MVITKPIIKEEDFAALNEARRSKEEEDMNSTLAKIAIIDAEILAMKINEVMKEIGDNQYNKPKGGLLPSCDCSCHRKF